LIEAILMIGDRLVGIKEMPTPLSAIRFCVALMAEPLYSSSSIYDITSTVYPSTVFSQYLIFKLHRRIGYKQYEYQYDHIQTNERFAIQIHESFEFLQEPNEKIN